MTPRHPDHARVGFRSRTSHVLKLESVHVLKLQPSPLAFPNYHPGLGPPLGGPPNGHTTRHRSSHAPPRGAAWCRARCPGSDRWAHPWWSGRRSPPPGGRNESGTRGLACLVQPAKCRKIRGRPSAIMEHPWKPAPGIAKKPEKHSTKYPPNAVDTPPFRWK